MTAQPLPVPVGSVQGTLALEVMPRLDPPEVTCPTSTPGADLVAVPLPLRRDLDRWSRRFLQAASEIAGGDRPAAQLVRWTSREVQADLERRAQLVARAAGQLPGEGRRRTVSARPQVVSLHTCFVSPTRAEVSARLRTGPRFRAVAACFEVVAGRWRCTALEFG